MADPTITTPWGEVTCGDCGRTYMCRPNDDHYKRVDDLSGAGVCWGCLLKNHPPAAPTEPPATEEPQP